MARVRDLFSIVLKWLHGPEVQFSSIIDLERAHVVPYEVRFTVIGEESRFISISGASRFIQIAKDSFEVG